jgi:hypothetical protein
MASGLGRRLLVSTFLAVIFSPDEEKFFASWAWGTTPYSPQPDFEKVMVTSHATFFVPLSKFP